MKTKNKILALLEIAIVLCSVFLVAMPAIAAEQTTQKVSASITTASEDNTLEIYGNANEDDTIDMRDLTYVKLIFFGKKPETELADAKYDGKINPLDFIQIKLIIVGKEQEITIVDNLDRIVTVSKPVTRIASTYPYPVDAIRILGAVDKIVAVSSLIDEEVFFPELKEVPKTGVWPPDCEVILSVNPDLVIASEYMIEHGYVDNEKLPGIPIVAFQFFDPNVMVDEMVKLGYILNKESETMHYLDDFYDKYIDSIKEQTEGLSEEDKPKVYVESFYMEDYKVESAYYVNPPLEIAGGRNIFADESGYPIIDPEEIIVENPDVIIRDISSYYAGSECVGYTAEDTSEIEGLWESIMSRPELAGVTAVKEGRVYIMDANIQWGLDYPISVAYWAKWCQPELFEDLDPQAIHQEYLTELHGLDYDLNEHGIFVYHPEEHPDGK